MVLSDGTDSPVKDASSIWNAAISISLASAGTLLPVSRRIKSPGTNSLESISISIPSLMTFAFSAVNFFSASIACSALYSWINPKIPLSTTIVEMTIASSFSPIRREITRAARRMKTIDEVNCLNKIWSGEIVLLSLSSLTPCSSSLFSVSSKDNPFWEVSRDLIVSDMFKL